MNLVVTDEGELPAVESHSATGLTLISGQTYYASVRGYNWIGYGTSLASDGITIDNELPIAGGVYNGNSPYHVDIQPSPEVVEAHWFGFDDHATYILGYEWAIGTVDDIENVQAYTDVSVFTASKAEGLSLEVGVEYVITVKAWDASGFHITSTSPVFRVDTTAPVPGLCPEDDEPIIVVEDNAFDGTGWELVTGELTESTANDSTTNMRGKIMRNVTLLQHQIYTLKMHTSAPCNSGYTRIKLDYAEVILNVIPTLEADCEFHYRFISQRASETAEFSIYSIEGLNIKNVLLTECSVDPVEEGDPIFIQMIGATDCEVQWYIDDRESNIRFYEFMLGTTPGGSQLTRLANWGVQNTAYLFNLPVSHNNSVWATVWAENKAGLRTKFMSGPAVVDWTPPKVPTPIVSIFPVAAQFVIQATWNGAEDLETGIADNACSWSIGKSILIYLIHLKRIGLDMKWNRAFYKNYVHHAQSHTHGSTVNIYNAVFIILRQEFNL